MSRRLLAAAAASVLALTLVGATPAAAATPEAPDEDPVRSAEYWLEDYGIEKAWETTRGDGVRIAVIDTGIGRGPVEFEGAVVGGTDVSGIGTPDGRTPVGAVDSNHGSWVASLAAGRGTGPDTGMIGVAPEAELLSVSVGFGASATRSFTEQIAEAIRWSVDNGADVINMSLTTNVPDWDRSWDDAFLYAMENDVVVVVAAGNRGSGTTRVGAPATIPGVLTVAGVDPLGKASVEASTQGITIGVSAPSENLVGVSADGRLVLWNGTSGAAPIVAGIVALVRSAHPELDAANVINRIVETARPASGASAVPDPLYGYGLVDAAAAVSASVPTVAANPMGSLSEWIRIYRRAQSDPVPTRPVEPFEVAPLPPADVVDRAASPLLPSRETVIYGTLPLSVATATAILVALGVTAAVRRIRLASRAPSR
ncbi:S8 family serine peptidase [Microbacterium insulae]|uniref:S8 family serine peptidase n=1 Tax=Microbacterium insulae TaxID=483014 RepID=A0ABW3AJI9_9MICO